MGHPRLFIEQANIVPFVNKTAATVTMDCQVIMGRKKTRRKRRTAGGAVGGAVARTLILGPVGSVLGDATGGVATNKLCKARERIRQRKHEQQNFQQRLAVHSALFA